MSSTPPESRSSDTKLLVILHRLQAASHLGDFVPTSPLARMALAPLVQVNPSPPRAWQGDPDTLASPASPPGSVTGLSAPGRCPAHAGPESRLPHWPEGKSQNPARPRPPPDKVPPPARSRPSLRPALAPPSPLLGCAGVLLGPFSFPPVSRGPPGQGPFPRGCFWVPAQALAPGTGPTSFLHWVSFPRGPARPPVDRLLPTAPRPSAQRCVWTSSALLKGRADGGRRDAGSRLSGCKIWGVFTSLGSPWGWVNGGGVEKPPKSLLPPPWGW